jgi:hypothetical protein
MITTAAAASSNSAPAGVGLYYPLIPPPQANGFVPEPHFNGPEALVPVEHPRDHGLSPPPPLMHE